MTAPTPTTYFYVFFRRAVGAVALVGLSATSACGALVGIEEVTPAPTLDDEIPETTEVASAGPACRVCGATCVDPLTDAAHCGQCDHACAAGEACLAGVCDRRLRGNPNAHSMCLRGADEIVRCWGSNRFGQLGRGTISIAEATPAPPIGPTTDALFAGADDVSACSLLRDGTVRCGGANLHGNLGTGTPGGTDECAGSPVCELTPATALLPEAADDVVSGGAEDALGFLCARLRDRALFCWGRGIARTTPVDRLHDVALVRSGNAFACALSFSGETYCFGSLPGVAGTSSALDVIAEPALIREVPPSQLLALGARDIYASDGRQAFAEGANNLGQVGDGTTDPPLLRPIGGVALPADFSVVQLEAGQAHACALSADGRVFCWGERDAVGAPASAATMCLDGPCVPTPTEVLADAKEIAAGADFTLALRRDGTLWGWGHPTPAICVLVRDGACATEGFQEPTELRFGPLR
jgi:hypothetical protein